MFRGAIIPFRGNKPEEMTDPSRVFAKMWQAEESLMDAILSAGDDVAKEEKAKREAEQLAKEQEAAGIVPRSGGTPSTEAKAGL